MIGQMKLKVNLRAFVGVYVCGCKAGSRLYH